MFNLPMHKSGVRQGLYLSRTPSQDVGQSVLSTQTVGQVLSVKTRDALKSQIFAIHHFVVPEQLVGITTMETQSASDLFHVKVTYIQLYLDFIAKM